MKKIIFGALAISLMASTAFAHGVKSYGNVTVTVCKADPWGDSYNWNKNQWETCKEVLRPRSRPHTHNPVKPTVTIDIKEEAAVPLILFWLFTQQGK